MAPSIWQYAGAAAAGTQRGLLRVTVATGSPIAPTGIEEPSLSTEQSDWLICLVGGPETWLPADAAWKHKRLKQDITIAAIALLKFMP